MQPPGDRPEIVCIPLDVPKRRDIKEHVVKEYGIDSGRMKRIIEGRGIESRSWEESDPVVDTVELHKRISDRTIYCNRRKAAALDKKYIRYFKVMGCLAFGGLLTAGYFIYDLLQAVPPKSRLDSPVLAGIGIAAAASIAGVIGAAISLKHYFGHVTRDREGLKKFQLVLENKDSEGLENLKFALEKGSIPK